MSKALWLIAGLGNPGRKYSRSRHNAGFMALDRIAQNWRIRMGRRKFDAEFGTGKIDGADAVLVKPMTYMNRSGLPISRAAAFFQIPLDHVLVIHDDIDIGYGHIKIKKKGGHGGHNGLRSIIDAVGSGDFPRIKVGIGRPEGPIAVSDYVLGNFSASEFADFEPVLGQTAEAAAVILQHGMDQGMNRFN